ncbi:CHAT domain-containing protein [Methylobacterium sp. 1030]|uniref:CHAT domain-containing protein n=1 Tax=Methylobacterium sp. 1030 TaxID=3156404 RepID=UPI0033959ACC
MPRISAQQVAIIRFELERGNPKRKKVALQDLCSLYRKEFFLGSDEVHGVEATINGLLLQTGQDLKVVRWCLNALAQFGRYKNSEFYVNAALKKYQGNAEIEAAGVAALCFMRRGDVGSIEALADIHPTIWKLAALQNTSPKNLDLGSLKIDIDTAENDVLRLALITVGLNRDIEHLFHPKHKNGVLVKRLGEHPDDIVQQYSVWAVIENSRLDFHDLGIQLDKIRDLKSNVQAKVYQLVAERDPDLRRRLAITAQGSSFETSEDAREGLAKGIRSSYYDGLEGITLDWFPQEENPIVRGHLAEHFARFSDDCPLYQPIALRINEEAPSLSERLMLGAAKTNLHSKLQAAETITLLDRMGNAYDLGAAIRDRIAGIGTRSAFRVLLLSASPIDKPRMRLEEEQRNIDQRLRLLKNSSADMHFSFEPAARTQDLLANVLGSYADIFHFSGHGISGGLIFEDASGHHQIIYAEEIADYLARLGRNIKCVLLNACFSTSLAAALNPYVDYVIGCNSAIDDDAAITFAGSFYVSLAGGLSFDEAFRSAAEDVALNHSRREADKYAIYLRAHVTENAESAIEKGK